MKTITLVFTFLIISSISLAQIPTNGLVGYWPLDGNANDFSGNNLHGTVNGSTPISDRFGNTNSAYHFNGVSDFIEVANDTLLNLPIMSVSVWVRKQSLNNQYEEILSKESASPNRNVNYKFQINTVNEMTFYAASDSAAALDNCANTTFTLANWNHFVGIYDGTNVKMYMNDTLILNVCHPSHVFYPSTTNVASLTFGRLSIYDPTVSSWMFYEGDIDDIRLYNRVVDSTEVHALFTESQVSQNCIVGSLPISISHGLVAWYPFCGNANDETQHGHNGAINGATLSTDRFGNNNSAYLFDGSNDNIVITNAPELNIQNGQSFSVALWLKSDTLNSAKYFLSKYSGVMGQSEAYAFGTQDVPNPGGMYSYFEHSGGNIEVRGITQVADTNWHQFACVFSSGQHITTYVDGQIDTVIQTSFAGSIINNLDLSIGAGGISQFFKGKLDDVRIYNRALDSTEISALYNENICFQTVTVTDTLIINANLTSFNPITYQNSIKIYPNPAYDHITIDNGSNYSTLAGYTLRIDNSLAQTVFSTVVTQQIYSIDLSTWNGNGIYFLYLINSTGHIVDVKKIVIQ